MHALLVLFGLVYILTTLSVIFVVHVYRVMRLTSPGLNYIFLTGISVFYLSVFFRIMPSTQYTVNAVRCSVSDAHARMHAPAITLTACNIAVI